METNGRVEDEHFPETRPVHAHRGHRLAELLRRHGDVAADEPLGEMEHAVVAAAASGGFVTANPAERANGPITLGQRAADAVARFGGSWTFILLFAGVLVAWMALNALLLRKAAFDPYPFILLNLVLSCLAAIQAPIIMMSQRRQDERDRVQAENDYKVNLKAELEVREMREALDRLHAEHGAILADLHGEIAQIRVNGVPTTPPGPTS